jgi:hypothetical protein
MRFSGLTWFAASYSVAGSTSVPRWSFTVGVKKSKKARERPTWFSQSRDCDSWTERSRDSPRGVP